MNFRSVYCDDEQLPITNNVTEILTGSNSRGGMT